MRNNKKYGFEEQVMGPLGILEMEAGKFYRENPAPAPAILQLINQIDKKVFDVVPVCSPYWVGDDPCKDKGWYTTELLESDGTDMEREVYNASIASLLGDQGMMKCRVVSWPEEFKLST